MSSSAIVSLVSYIVVVLVGALVGAIELATRYRDRPSALVKLPSAWLYVLVNAGASAGALLLAHTFAWNFGISSNIKVIATVQVLACGFGAMIIFRSSVAMIKVGDQDAAIGPNVVLTSLLAIADRAVDRTRGAVRSTDIARIMNGVSFEKAQIALPANCLALLQNVPPAEQQELSTAINSLSATTMSDALKSLNLGLLLMNLSGPVLLEAAVKALENEIKGTAVI
jgi:hypothetical protein